MRSGRASIGLVVLLAAAAAAPLARADDPKLGEPWEQGILDGLKEQELALKSRPAQALLTDAKAKAGRPGDPTTQVVRLYLLARAYGLAGDVASARQTYQDLLRAAPRAYFAWHDLAMLDVQANPPAYAAAEANLRKALQAHPGFLTALRKLAAIYLRQERYADAIVVLRRVLDVDPSDLEARSRLVLAYMKTGKTADAQREVALLRQREPKSLDYRALEADVALVGGDAARSRDAYKAITAEAPRAAASWRGLIRAIKALGERGWTDELTAELRYAVEALLRVERDPAQQKALKEALAAIEAQSVRRARPEGPPTDAEIAQVIAGPKPEGRAMALRYVLVQEKAPAPEILRATMGRLDATREPDPTVRQWALRVLGRFGGYGLAGLVRHSISDGAPAVRLTAVDTLAALAAQDPAAHAGAVLVLAPLVTSPDAELATAARLTLVLLAKAGVDEQADGTEARHRDEFLAWWAGPLGRETKLQALEAFPRLRDHQADGVVLPYLRDPDFAVVKAAVVSLQACAAQAKGLPREAWWRTFPRVAPEELVETNRAAVLAKVDAWVRTRPG